jgi:hypothetical protein
MKRKYLSFLGAIAIFLSVISGCQKDDSNGYLTFLTIDTSIDKSSPGNLAIYAEAIQRMDPYINYEDGAFKLSRVSAARLAMSRELFEELKANMQQSNDYLKGLRRVEVSRNMIRIVMPGEVIPLTRLLDPGFEAERPANSLGVEMSWWGARVNLSRKDIADIGVAGGAATVVTRITAQATAAFPLVSGVAQALAHVTAGYLVAANAALLYCTGGAYINVSWVGIVGFGCQ